MSESAEFRVPIPLDADGFLRRECPACQREFKWLPSDDAEPVPTERYACPYCGQRAGVDAWFTQAQLQAVRDTARREVIDPMLDDFGREVERSTRGSLISIEVRRSPTPPEPDLSEPNDMRLVTPACHPEEPLKVSEDWDAPVHCLICGESIQDAA